MKPENIILEGITGSKAYGLDHADSDTDIKGIYIAPTSEILGLFNVKQTIDHTDPDWCYHEVGKFLNLALKCNPTILEILFLEGYTVTSKFGKMLVDNRHLFLSSTIYKSYGGYAVSQARKLNARSQPITSRKLTSEIEDFNERVNGGFGNGRNKRYSKHARHCFRLLYQGKELLETGSLTVRVSTAMRKNLFEIGELPVDELVSLFESEFTKFDQIKSVLPEKPQTAEINKPLLKIRKGNW